MVFSGWLIDGSLIQAGDLYEAVGDVSAAAQWEMLLVVGPGESLHFMTGMNGR